MRRFKSDLDITADDAEEHRADGPVVDLTRGQRTSDLADGSWHTLSGQRLQKLAQALNRYIPELSAAIARAVMLDPGRGEPSHGDEVLLLMIFSGVDDPRNRLVVDARIRCNAVQRRPL